MTNRSINYYLLSWTAYPAIIILGLATQATLLNLGNGLKISSYIPIIIGGILIALLELKLPYRKQWRPQSGDLKVDLLFTGFVQIILPSLLSFFFAITLLEYVNSSGFSNQNLRIHQWPLFIQVIAMMISAEFLRYWLHRLAHIWSPLWRLHAVHHSPDKLYWLNTGRFHPIEKGIQFLFDTLPFILLGISEHVLAVYFVFYALNGFFQHSNIDLRMGLLNYVISGAQLHRWHHSKVVAESDRNFGNNLIIWDYLFGTRYLPKSRQVGGLGLINSKYPMSFIKQMQTPFTPGIDKNKIPLLSFKDIFTNFKLQAGILLARFIYKLPFEHSLSKPMKYQHKLLRNIIAKNSKTEFGQQHDFNKIKSWQDFTNYIPIHDYEDLRGFIERQEQNKQTCLTAEQPSYYAITSGTTGEPKLIPVVSETIKQHKRALAIFSCVANKIKRHVFAGKLLAIPGAYHEGELAGGSLCGSISGLMYYLMPHYLRKKYVVPNEVFGLLDHELKYRLIIRLAIQQPSISYMVSANPSTFLKLIEIINEDIALFADDLYTGSFSGNDQLPADIRHTIDALLIKDIGLAQNLIALQKLGRKISYADIWPNLKLMVTWSGGSCGIAVTSLKTLLPADTEVIDLGYLASELRGTITLENSGNSGVPTFHDNVFEFIEVNRYKLGIRETIMLDQLVKGKQYFVIITTPAGLFRYFMNDIIEVTGFRKNTPLLCFIQKGQGVTNITGEKLSEQQLIVAVNNLAIELNITIPFYIALASVKNNRYELYIEGDIDAEQCSVSLDKKLRDLNTEYASKRASGRLHQLTVKRIESSTRHAYKAHEVSKGMRESQFKYLLLQNEDDCDFPFKDHLL